MKLLNKILIAVTAVSVLTACGGGGGSTAAATVAAVPKVVTAAVPIPVADSTQLANWTILSGFYKLSKVTGDSGKSYLLVTNTAPPPPPGGTAPVIKIIGQGIVPVSGVTAVAGQVPLCDANTTTGCATSLDGLFSIVIDYTTALITLDQAINTVAPATAWSPLFTSVGGAPAPAPAPALPMAATVTTTTTSIDFVPQTITGATGVDVRGTTFMANGVAAQAMFYAMPAAGTTLVIPLCSSLVAGDPQFCTTTLSGSFTFEITNSAGTVIASNVATLP